MWDVSIAWSFDHPSESPKVPSAAVLHRAHLRHQFESVICLQVIVSWCDGQTMLALPSWAQRSRTLNESITKFGSNFVVGAMLACEILRLKTWAWDARIQWLCNWILCRGRSSTLEWRSRKASCPEERLNISYCISKHQWRKIEPSQPKSTVSLVMRINKKLVHLSEPHPNVQDHISVWQVWWRPKC